MAITAETRTDIIEVVVGVIGAAPGANILSELADIVDGGLSLRDLTIALVENPVFKQVYPTFLTNEEFATQYLTAILDGEVSAETMTEAVDAVTALLNAGESRGAVVYEIINFLSGVSSDDETFGAAATNLANKVEVAEAYSVDTLQSGDTLEELQAVIADVDSTEASKTAALDEVNGTQNSGTNFTLTLGADEITGTTKNDTITSGDIFDGNATFKNTLTGLDVIDGAGGTDTLKIFAQDSALTVPTTTKVMNVENVTVNTVAGFTADMSSWTGLSKVNAEVVGGALDLKVSGIAVTGGNLDGAVTVEDASTVSLTDVDQGNNVTIDTGTKTTSVYVHGGADHYMNANGGNTDLVGGDTNSAVLSSVTIEDAAGSAAIDSDALTSLSLVDLDTATKTFLVDNATAGGHALSLTLDDVGYNALGAAVADIDVDDATATSVNITMGSRSNIGLIADAATKLTIAGSGVLTLTSAADTIEQTDTVESITISGDAGLVMDNTAGGTALETISAGSSTADNDLTLSAEVVSVTTGSGDDSVEVDAALAADSEVDLGSGDDTFTVAAGITHNVDASVDGGDGNDTLGLGDGADITTAAQAAVYSNFETLEVGGGTGTYELDLLGLTDIKVSADVAAAGVVLNDVAAGATLTAVSSKADLTVTTGSVTYALEDDSGSSDSMDVIFDANDGDDDATEDGEITIGALIADGIETINVAGNIGALDEDDADTVADESTDADDYVHTISDLDADAVKTLNITGNAQVSITTNAGTVALQQVVATSNTAGVTVNVSAGPAGGVTFNGSSGDDTFTGTANGDTIQGNAGDDTFTLGAGADTVRYTAATDSMLITADISNPADGVIDLATAFDRLVGFDSAGEDIIELSSSLGLATGDARADIFQKGAIAGGDDNLGIGGTGGAALAAFIGTGADFFDTGVVDRAVAVANNGTDTFVFVDVNGDGDFTATSDLGIVLTGVVALDIADFTFG